MQSHGIDCRCYLGPESNNWIVRHVGVQETLDTYRRASGLGTQTRVATALTRWGPNKFEVPLPPFGELLVEHLLAPFFCFQTLCVALWALDDYWCSPPSPPPSPTRPVSPPAGRRQLTRFGLQAARVPERMDACPKAES